MPPQCSTTEQGDVIPAATRARPRRASAGRVRVKIAAATRESSLHASIYEQLATAPVTASGRAPRTSPRTLVSLIDPSRAIKRRGAFGSTPQSVLCCQRAGVGRPEFERSRQRAACIVGGICAPGRGGKARGHHEPSISRASVDGGDARNLVRERANWRGSATGRRRTSFGGSGALVKRASESRGDAGSSHRAHERQAPAEWLVEHDGRGELLQGGTRDVEGEARRGPNGRIPARKRDVRLPGQHVPAARRSPSDRRAEPRVSKTADPTFRLPTASVLPCARDDCSMSA